MLLLLLKNTKCVYPFFLFILKPSNPYSATKAAADQLITAWNRTYNLPYIILRPTNNYGIGQYVEKLIPKSIKYLTLGNVSNRL